MQGGWGCNPQKLVNFVNFQTHISECICTYRMLKLKSVKLFNKGLTKLILSEKGYDGCNPSEGDNRLLYL